MNKEILHRASKEFGTPLYLYCEKTLEKSADEVLAMPNAFGLTVRFAMKALPTKEILKIFKSKGIKIDASSEFEVLRAVNAGYGYDEIQLSSQELASNLKELVNSGLKYNACSLRQLEEFGKLFPGKELGIRINPGIGTGWNNRTNVGGISSSFGIWHEKINEAKELIKKYNLKIIRVHTHIGSGSNPDIWKDVSVRSISLLEHFEDATILDLGGGFKVARMPEEKTTDILEVGNIIKEAFINFHSETARKIHLEIEPGNFLAARAGHVLSKIDDIVDTGPDAYKFYKLDSGMTDILRPSLYGAQHPIEVFNESADKKEEVIFVGHCCESGDILTPAPNNPEELKARLVNKAQIGDLVLISGAGAYCSSMSAKNYNSFPESPEALITKNGELKLIRKKQTLEQLTQNEV